MRVTGCSRRQEHHTGPCGGHMAEQYITNLDVDASTTAAIDVAATTTAAIVDGVGDVDPVRAMVVVHLEYGD